MNQSKYGQQEQVAVRNHNRSTALERSVLKYWRLKPVLRDPNLAISFFYDWKHIVSCSVHVKVFLLINGSSRETNKSQINTMMKQRWGLDRNNVLRPTPGDPWGVELHRCDKRKPIVEPWWAKQEAKTLRSQPTKINSFMSGLSLSPTPDPPACN